MAYTTVTVRYSGCKLKETMKKLPKIIVLLLIFSMLFGISAFASDEAASGEAIDVGAAASSWTEATLEEIEEAVGLALVVPEGVEYTASYIVMAQATWVSDGVTITERIVPSAEEPSMDSDTLVALAEIDFTGISTESKELTVGGRCNGYMEFCMGAVGAIMWYDGDLGVIYTLNFSYVSDPKEMGDLAEVITPMVSGADETSMIIIDGCAIAHDLTAVPVSEIEDTSDFLWKVVDGYGITYTDEDGVTMGIYRAGEAGVFEIVVTSENDPSPWTVGDQLWVGGSMIVELCVEDGVLTHILTDELVSGSAYDVEILDTAA